MVSAGAEGKALEAKEQALTAQEKALELGADKNAPEQYSSATDIMNEALANHAAANYESSYLWFVDAKTAFNAAAEVSAGLKSENETALAAAREAVAASEKKAATAGVEDTVYLPEAKYYLSRAEIQSENALFADSTYNANEAVNYAGMSERFVDGKIAEKTKADTAIGDAKTRMAWAENNEVAKDYPAEYKEASAAMQGAELAYANERYAPAAELAGEVSSILSDEFQAQVLAEREKAAEKAKADTAIGDAKTRMAWAENNEIAKSYPTEYKEASAAMQGAELAYANERYAPAAELAGEVSSILSDEFQAQVLAEREKTAAANAAKADADAAMADAQARMAWANENGIKEDYPEEYSAASTSMISSFNAFGKAEYSEATAKAKEVSSILSDEFKAQVQADREAEAKADTAIGDAKTRMAWAENNEIAKDYPAEYKEASAAMQGAELAYANERYAPAAELAGEVSSILSDEFQAQVLAGREKTAAANAAKADADAAKAAALTELDNAQARYDWAKGNNAENNYPDLFAKGGSDLAKAKQSYDSGNYADASAMAKEAMKSLSNIKAFAPLPAVYIVRLIPERRDCLWRIAEYPFIYNNPLKWPVLYEANKKTFRDPSNPDLIFPDQVLNIPAIKGESRSGTWDPKKTYDPLPKK